LHLHSRRRGACLILPRSCGQLLKLQFHLIDKPLAALGNHPLKTAGVQGG
jgi:hypothetical protein